MKRPLATVAVATVLVLAFGVAATPQGLAPLPPQPDGLSWPTEHWPEGPLPRELHRARFDTHVEKLFESRGRGGVRDTRALLVVHRGRLVFKRYAEGFGPTSRFQSWSMAKSVTNALVGLLVHDGRLSLDAPAPIRAWSDPEDPRSAITLAQLLEMRSGLDNADGFGEDTDMTTSFIARMAFGEGSRQPAAFAAAVPLRHPIGTRWAYSSATSVLLAAIAGRIVGDSATETRDFLRQELFAKLGMSSAQPEFAKSGEFIGGVFMHATARDWARFGYLYLRDGIWNDERILPKGWVDYSRTVNPAENNAVYGAHFWLNTEPGDKQWKVLPGGPPSAFAAEGAEFQMVVVVPSHDLVAVRLGLSQGTPFPQNKEPFGPLLSAFPPREGQ